MLDGIERALIIKQPHIGMFLAREKHLEMRSTHTNIRGKIALIESGSGLITGTSYLISSEEFSLDELTTKKMAALHRIDYKKFPEYEKYRYGWYLTNSIKLDEPVEYKHPKGAVIWVNKNAWI